MKEILFTRHHFNQIIALKQVYTSLAIVLYPHRLHPRHSYLRSFFEKYDVDIKNFLPLYDNLKTQVNLCNRNLQYFDDCITNLGLNCLKFIDEIGSDFDNLFEEILIKDFVEEPLQDHQF